MGCSSRSTSAERREAAAQDAAAPAAEARVPVPEPLPIGAPALDAYGYRRGPGRADYERAVKAEKLAREDADWVRVVDACRAALARDPGHLDAAWLLAAALARLGRHDEMLAPLSQAVAGDWGKWGERSLSLPLLADFLGSRWGTAWRSLAERYRAAFGESARRAVVVLGRDAHADAADLDRRTEIYGWDPALERWLRLTRTGGTVVAALPAPAGAGLVAYVAYRELGRPGDRKGALRRPRVAVVELETGRVSREIAFADVDQLRLGWRTPSGGGEPTLVAAIGGGEDAGAWALDWKRGRRKADRAAAPRDAVVVARGQVRRLRLPVADITADWDDDGLASAIRLDATRKTITPPAGLVVDGQELVWSPDRARLALVATPDGDCAAPATVFVVDAATGKLHRLGQAPAPAPLWVDGTHLAYTAGDRVRVVDVTTARADRELTSTGGVATAIVDRSCAPATGEALFAPGPDDDVDEDVFADPDVVEPDAIDAGAAPLDAAP